MVRFWNFFVDALTLGSVYALIALESTSSSARSSAACR